MALSRNLKRITNLLYDFGTYHQAAKEVILGHLKEGNKINGIELRFPYMVYTWLQSSKTLIEQVFYRELSLWENVSLH